MSHSNQHFGAAGPYQHQPPSSVQGSAPQSYVTAQPPIGYPTKNGIEGYCPEHNNLKIETKRRGDGFWKGCCAALCCCWVLDVCCC